MTFGLSMRGVSYVTTYGAAVAMYNKATPWRGEDVDGECPLPQKRSRDYGVRMDGTDVVFRYHRTDVIRWHKDGSYTLDTGGYRTRSTGEFASNFMPQRHCLEKEASCLRINGEIWPIAGHKVTVSADGIPSGEGPYPVSRPWLGATFVLIVDGTKTEFPLKDVHKDLWPEDILAKYRRYGRGKR